MDFERGQDPKKSMGIGVSLRLEESDCMFTHTSLGEPVFIKKDAPNASDAIRPRDWTVEQLRLFADYMEAYPECTKIGIN